MILSHYHLGPSNMLTRNIYSEFPNTLRQCFPTLFLQFSCIFLLNLILPADSRRLNSYGQRTSGGKLIKIASIFPPVFNPNNVPRSYKRLNST
jgi:hypothetical protein